MEDTTETRLAAARESIAAGEIADELLDVITEHGNPDDFLFLTQKLPETEESARKLFLRLLNENASGMIEKLSTEQINFDNTESPIYRLAVSVFSTVRGESALPVMIRLVEDSQENGLAKCVFDAFGMLDGEAADVLARKLTGELLRLKAGAKEWKSRASLLATLGETAVREIMQAMELAWEPDREKLADLLAETAATQESRVLGLLEEIFVGDDNEMKLIGIRTLAGMCAANAALTGKFFIPLDSTEQPVREAAIEAVKSVTGEEFGFQAAWPAGSPENEDAAGRLKKWSTPEEKTAVEVKPEIKIESTHPAAKTLSIAVYNAAFDPIHTFHLWAVQHILNENIADRVVFVPKGNPGPEREIAPDQNRLEMLRLAVVGMEGVEVSDFEILSEERVRSFEVLLELKRKFDETEYEPSLSLIVGQETLARMPRWRIFHDLIDKFGVLVVPRGKRDPDRIIRNTPVLRRHRQSIRVLRLPFEFELSSTYVRDCVADGRSTRFLMPEAVREYIGEKGLYKTHYKSHPHPVRQDKPRRQPPSGPPRFHWCSPDDKVEGTKINLSGSEKEFAALSPRAPHGRIPVPGMEGIYADSVEGIWEGLKLIHGRIDTRFFESQERKRRAHGRIEGHKFGDETLDYVEARKIIFRPSYLHTVKTNCNELVDKLVGRFKEGEVIFLHDDSSNPDIENTFSTLSHAAILVEYLNKEVLGIKVEAPARSGSEGESRSTGRAGHRGRKDGHGRHRGDSAPQRGKRSQHGRPRHRREETPDFRNKGSNEDGAGGFERDPDDSDDAGEIWDPENL
ncbi:MAG: nicotinate (nicotinamide) nucleotide adenylyltransferase [Planctomycetota bacterium]|jgi:nicotinate (nicotinamide) nucleotide adenylyltransferase